MQWEQALQKFTASDDLALLERLLSLLDGQSPPSQSPSVQASNVQAAPQEAQQFSSSAAAKAQACSSCPTHAKVPLVHPERIFLAIAIGSQDHC